LVDNIAFSPNGQLLAADEDAGDVVIWQIGDNREIRRFKEDNVNALNFSPDGSFLAIGIIYSGPGALHGEVHVWSMQTNDMQPTWNLYLSDFVHSIAFDSTGLFIAAGGGFAGIGSSILGDGDFWPVRQIAIWRTHDGQHIQTISSPHKEVTNLVFSPDNGTLISTGRDRNAEGNLCFWRVLPHSSWWNWSIPGSFITVLAGQMLWRWYRRR
jgi:WD40 repeat protein